MGDLGMWHVISECLIFKPHRHLEVLTATTTITHVHDTFISSQGS